MALPNDFLLSWKFTAQAEGVKFDPQGNVVATGLNTTPGDPGGTTNFGFAQKYNPDIDVTTLDWPTASQRAHDKYWVPSGCDRIAWPANLIVFDTCFNEGPDQAQQLLTWETDWNSMLWERLRGYTHRNPQFYRGWSIRVLQCRDYIKDTPHV